jgi:hypothetical protein
MEVDFLLVLLGRRVWGVGATYDCVALRVDLMREIARRNIGIREAKYVHILISVE